MLWLSIALLLVGVDLDSLVKSSQIEKRETEILTPSYNHPTIITNDKVLNLDMIMQNETPELEKITRAERSRKRKEKHAKVPRIRNKTNKNHDLVMKRLNRNNEKDILVRNRTIEILKNGVKILSTSQDQSPESNKTSSNVNETLLEKILFSGSSKPDILISASGVYKLPIGGSMYENNATPELSDTKKVSFNQGEVDTSSKKGEDSDYDRAINHTTPEYEYEYEDFKDASDKNQIGKSYEKSYSYGSDFDSINSDHNVKIILQQIIATLRNFTVLKKGVNNECAAGNSSMDPCAKWLECKNHLEKAFLGQHILPSCPCYYPSTIFYNDAIWDQNQRRYFRWRDASNEGERLDIYKPGAVYCIRSLLAQNGASISSQQCCYDAQLRLLTRGSGAGTINFVSPDVSKTLHDTIDILPWRLCKGDFTRYNLARNPNNGNRCPVNPNQEQYEHQVKSSKYF